MPYIEPAARERLHKGGLPRDAGELNYCLTWHMIHTDMEDLRTAINTEVGHYVARQSMQRYSLYNEVVGTMECCRREFARRACGHCSNRDEFQRDMLIRDMIAEFYDTKVGPYEDEKIKQNGDVYPI